MTKRWSELSSEAAAILEWVKDIYDDTNNVISLKVGELPRRGVLTIPGANTPLTEPIFMEIGEYLSGNSELATRMEGGVLLVGLPEALEAHSDASNAPAGYNV